MHENIKLAPIANPEIMGKDQWHDLTSQMVEQANEIAAQGRGEELSPLSVVFIDVNCFKDVNDILGHEMGDKVINDIKQVVGFVSQNLRVKKEGNEDLSNSNSSETAPERYGDTVSYSSDYDSVGNLLLKGMENDAGHIGGDEFAIRADTDEVGIQIMISRIRKAFNNYINLPENLNLKELKIGLAIGTATHVPGMTSSELLKQADEAMYADKINQLPQLTNEQFEALEKARADLAALNLRLRDIPKYERWLEVINKN